jgi:hypothetical protein
LGFYVPEEGMWLYKEMLLTLLGWGYISMDEYVGILLRLDELWRDGDPMWGRLDPWDLVP